MRELVGKLATKDPNVTEVVYLAEVVRCLECEKTAPIGIEVVTIRKTIESRKTIRHVCYCRAHGFEYEEKAKAAPIRPLAPASDMKRRLFSNLVWGAI